MKIIRNLPFEDYCRIKAMNASMLVHGKRSLLALEHYYKNGDNRNTDEMRVGHFGHSLVFEPMTVESKYCKWEGKQRRGKEWDNFIEANPGKTPIKAEEWLVGLKMRDSLLECRATACLIRGGLPEVTIKWKHKNFPMKCRFDMWHRDQNILVDLKTTGNPTPTGFGRTAANLDYPFKLGLYAHVIKLITGSWPIVELPVVATTPPHESTVYTVPHYIIEDGANRAIKMMDLYLDCRRKNNFTGIQCDELRLPEWATPDLDESEIEWSSEL